jgi:lysozyme family protein
MEGGYTDDPYDPGGPTNLGITLGDLARYKGVELTAQSVGELKAELKQLPAATAERIYRDRYWQPGCCADLPPPIALMHFDAAVNQGVKAAARMLQQAVGVEMDAEIGPITLAAVAAQPIPNTLGIYAEIRRQRYRGLSHFWRFGRGWLARVDRALAAATALASARTAPGKYQLPHQPKEPTTMTEQPQPAETPAAAKWWGSSMTVWGAVLTALTTVLPVVGPLFGLNITADLVQQVGDQVVVLVQAAGGLAGTILTIYGRARATTVLERRQITLSM